MSEPYYQDERVTLYHGDCLEVLASLPNESIDAVCTDPPYGLEFMGKDWDAFRPTTTTNRGGVAPGRSTEQEGRWVAVEYGTAKRRTTLTCDACGKSDKFKKPHGCPEGTEWTRIYLDNSANNAATMRAFGQWCELWTAECLRVLKPGGHLLAFGGTRTWHRLACAVEDAGFEVRDSIAWLYGSGFSKGGLLGNKAGLEWCECGPNALPRVGCPRCGGLDPAFRGFSTTLKPAFEPVVVARKPLAGTVAANVLQHGTGALNIDACRVEGEPWKAHRATGLGKVKFFTEGETPVIDKEPHAAGRWPANVVLDDSQAAVLDEQSGVSAAKPERTGRKGGMGDNGTLRGYGTDPDTTGTWPADPGGGASRFFKVISQTPSDPSSDFPRWKYEAKAPTSERPRYTRPMLRLRADLTPEQVDHVRARLAEAGVRVD